MQMEVYQYELYSLLEFNAVNCVYIWILCHINDIQEVSLTCLATFSVFKETPYVCFNKEGTLLAAFANESKIKILANDDGRQLLQKSNFQSSNSAGCLSESLQKVRNQNLFLHFLKERLSAYCFLSRAAWH